MLRKPPLNKPKEEESEFETICRLAREMDVEGLREMKSRNFLFLYERQDGLTPQKLLAMEGNEEAVNMLMETFGASGGDVVSGYAEVGLVEKVNELSVKKEYTDFPNFEMFVAYLNRWARVLNGWEYAIEGYVRGGFHAYVEDVLRENPDLVHVAVREYTKIENWDKVEECIARGGKLNVEILRAEALEDEHLCFRLLSLVNDETTRRQILSKANPWIADDEFEYIHLIKKAARMNRVMREYNLTFRQALPLHEFQENHELMGVRTWLLEGLQTTRARKENMPAKDGVGTVEVLPILSRDIFLKISSLLLGLPMEDTRQILVAVHAQLFASVAKENAKRFALGLFTPARYMSEQIKGMDHYDHKKRRIE